MPAANRITTYAATAMRKKELRRLYSRTCDADSIRLVNILAPLCCRCRSGREAARLDNEIAHQFPRDLIERDILRECSKNRTQNYLFRRVTQITADRKSSWTSREIAVQAAPSRGDGSRQKEKVSIATAMAAIAPKEELHPF